MSHENKILIVDDNEANRFCVESILMPLKLSPFQACSGDEALQQILSHDFAVILLDVEMPGLNGYETAKLIHNNKRFKNVPIVMVTAREYSKQQYLHPHCLLTHEYAPPIVRALVVIVGPLVVVGATPQTASPC